MPQIVRSSIISGPCLIQFAGQKFWSKGDVSLDFKISQIPIPTASFGEVDQRVEDREVEVVFEPSGAMTAAVALVLWPYASTAVGASLFNVGGDRALEIFGRNGRKITVHAAAITKMPVIRLGVSATAIGSLTFTGLCKDNTDPGAAGAYYTEAAVAYPGDAGFNVADIKTAAASAAWGASSPWNSFLSESGFEISFDLGLARQKVDGIGTMDMTFQSLGVTLKAVPVGPSAADIMSRMLPTSALGTSLASADNLVVTAGNVAVSISKPGLVDSGLAFGAAVKRIKATTWRATRTITSGTADPLYTVTVS